MSLRQTLFVALLTALYLCVELSFNARLLDVVGGGASESQIHSIEIYGRTLSGVALALFVLQGLLYLRNRNKRGRPGSMMIIVVCAGVGWAMYFSLGRLTDYLVASSSPSFRHASVNIVLVQRALVDGLVRVDGLPDDETIFSRPQGKAFLALFPLMAVSVERLDEKIRAAKLDLIKNQVASELGGAVGYYKKYAAAVQEAAKQWQRYSATSNADSGNMDLAGRQDKAWNDYLNDLSKRGWTQYTVPDRYRATVLRKVQAKIPVPADWDLVDEEVFRDAVKRRVAGSGARVGDGFSVGGKKIPPGLTWEAFFSQPAVQAELRKKLQLPSRVVLRTVYRSGDEFERSVFEPLVSDAARQKLIAYDAPVATYAAGGKHEQLGRDMARAAIVPPLALFFSLLGALAHLGKLIFLCLKAGLHVSFPEKSSRRYLRYLPVGMFLIVILGSILVLRHMENDVTQSRLYGFLETQVISDGTDSLKPLILANGLHIVAVGQGVFYPGNEWLRMNMLGGLSFGYEAIAKISRH
jgi:branched-subunit amino acid transport protein